MDSIGIWSRYAKIWSLDKESRELELEACLSSNANYCDLNGKLNGQQALADYMGFFQEKFPNNSFRILDATAHDGGSLSRWVQLGANNEVIHHGASFATHDKEGRLESINGFFPLEN